MAMTASELSADDLLKLLNAGAWSDPQPHLMAALHLLGFTELPYRPGFAELVEVLLIPEYDDGHDVQIAVIRDWAALLALPAVGQLSADDRRLLALAGSLASGQPVSLTANTAVKSHRHALRIIEAMVICTDLHRKYDITPGKMFPMRSTEV